MERLMSLKSNFDKEDILSLVGKENMNENEIDKLFHAFELDRGVTNVLENQLDKLKTRLQPEIQRMIRFHTTQGKKSSTEVVSEIISKPKEGLVVFVDDNFINHQSMLM